MTDSQNTDFQSILQQGEIELDKNHLDKAEELLRRAVELDPSSGRALNKLGVAMIRGGRKAEAKRCFEQAVLADERHAPAYSNLGNLYREEGNLDRAVELYEKAIRVDPEFPTAYHNLGVVLKQQGKVGASVDHLKKAAKLQRSYTKDDLKKVPKKQRVIAYAVLTGIIASILFFLLKAYRG